MIQEDMKSFPKNFKDVVPIP